MNEQLWLVTNDSNEIMFCCGLYRELIHLQLLVIIWFLQNKQAVFSKVGSNFGDMCKFYWAYGGYTLNSCCAFRRSEEGRLSVTVMMLFSVGCCSVTEGCHEEWGQCKCNVCLIMFNGKIHFFLKFGRRLALCFHVDSSLLHGRGSVKCGIMLFVLTLVWSRWIVAEQYLQLRHLLLQFMVMNLLKSR